MSSLKLTIGVTSYNLAPYIKQALESVLSQKTNFAYRIQIVDDASTDQTPQILRTYQSQFPDRIQVIFLEKNGGNLHTLNTIFTHIQTPYFLLLDGDDYLLHPHVLQKCVEFLDQHPDFTLCGGNTRRLRDGRLSKRVIPRIKTGLVYTLDDFWTETCPYVHTSALIVRNVIYNKGVPPEYIHGETSTDNVVYRGDTMRFFHHLQRGKLFLFPDDFSVYRIRSNGIWQGASSLTRLLKLTFYNLRCTAIFPENKRYFTRLFFWNYKKLLRQLYRTGGQRNALTETDRILLNDLLHCAQTYPLDWTRFRYDTSLLIKCWIKARAYQRILFRHIKRVGKKH